MRKREWRQPGLASTIPASDTRRPSLQRVDQIRLTAGAVKDAQLTGMQLILAGDPRPQVPSCNRKIVGCSGFRHQSDLLGLSSIDRQGPSAALEGRVDHDQLASVRGRVVSGIWSRLDARTEPPASSNLQKVSTAVGSNGEAPKDRPPQQPTLVSAIPFWGFSVPVHRRKTTREGLLGFVAEPRAPPSPEWLSSSLRWWPSR